MVKVRLSAEEEAWLVPKAAAMGVSVQRLLVESTMAGGQASVVQRRAVFRLLEAAGRDVHGVAVNINQMARWGNENRQFPGGLDHTVRCFEAAQARLQEAAAEVLALFGGAAEVPEP